MRFLLDHDIPATIARTLRAQGHEAVELRSVMAIETADEQVFDYAKDQKLLMLTCNRDHFLKLAARGPHPGLIVLIRRQTRQSESSHLLSLLDRAGDAGLSGNINFA